MSLGFPTRSDKNGAEQPQKMVSLKFRRRDCIIYFTKTKTHTDQLACYCAADLHLCLYICKKQVFL